MSKLELKVTGARSSMRESIDKNRLWELLQIRYVKLHFHIRMLEDSRLPKNKVSALRGGMGEMLLRTNCIRNRVCEKCDFVSECIVRKTMYSKLEIQPEFMQKNDSVGYVLECEDYKEEYYAGDVLSFQLILFGKNIVYLDQYLQAFIHLGMEGIGKYGSKFIVDSVTNTQRKILMDGGNIYIKNYMIQTVAEYVKYRLKSRQNENTIVFHTPMTIKYKGQMVEQIDMEAVMSAIARRVYIFDCFEGIEASMADIMEHVPKAVSQRTFKASVERYSSTHDEKIRLYGICGSAMLEQPDEIAKILLYAGELIHIGKNTSFGFGRYSLSKSR